jgi:hypothetical protein
MKRARLLRLDAHIAVPFEGEEADFFRIQPQTWGSAPPRAEIRDGELLFTYVRTDQNAQLIKRQHQEVVKYIVILVIDRVLFRHPAILRHRRSGE